MARSPVALALGGADTLWGDLERARTLVDPEDCIVVACNDAGFLWPGRLDHWVTLHAQEMWARQARRERRGFPGDYATWTRPLPGGSGVTDGFDRLLAGWERGSSGMLAAGVALEVADRVMLCGIPMTVSPHVNRDEGAWESAIGHRNAWREKLLVLKPRVRSWSGWTREVLGIPSAEWLRMSAGYETKLANVGGGS